MKKLLTVCLIFLVLPFQALALIECDCERTDCVCFIQEGDEGMPAKAVIGFLAERGYLRSAKGSVMDAAAVKAVVEFQRDAGLEMTGMLDDETLTMLIWGKSAAQMNAQDEKGGMLVYVPTDGGKKRHAKATCSGMDDPRKVSVRNAQAFEMDACKRCKPL